MDEDKRDDDGFTPSRKEIIPLDAPGESQDETDKSAAGEEQSTQKPGDTGPTPDEERGDAQSEEGAGKEDQEEHDDQKNQEDQEDDENAGQIRITDEMLVAHAESGIFRIALIGFPAAGKTFFVNRLKTELPAQEKSKKGLWEIKPEPSKKIGRTIGMWLHEFVWTPDSESASEADGNEAKQGDGKKAPDEAAQGEGNTAPGGTDQGAGGTAPATGAQVKDSQNPVYDKSFVIYDLAGEVIIGAEAGDFERLYNIAANSDAMIIVLPSDLLLGKLEPIADMAYHVHVHAEAELAALGIAAGGGEGAKAGRSIRAQKAKRQAGQKQERANQLQALLNETYLLHQEAGRTGNATDEHDIDDSAISDADRSKISKVIGRIETSRAEWNNDWTQFQHRLETMLATAAKMRREGLTYKQYQALANWRPICLKNVGATHSSAFSGLQSSRSRTALS